MIDEEQVDPTENTEPEAPAESEADPSDDEAWSRAMAAFGDDEEPVKAEEEPKPEAEASEEEPKPEAEASEGDDDAVEDEKLDSDRWAELVREEQRLRKDREEMRSKMDEERAALASEREAVARLSKAEKLLKDDPTAALEALGMSYEDLTAHYLNGGGASQKRALSEVEQLRQEVQAERDARAKADEEREFSRQRAEYVANVRSEVEAGGERWELTRSLPSWEDEVVAYATGHYEQTGDALTPADAADRLESYLEKEWSSRKGSAKLRRLLGLEAPSPSTPSASATSAGKAPEKVPSGSTLKNSDAAEAGTRELDMSDEACYARALAVAGG